MIVIRIRAKTLTKSGFCTSQTQEPPTHNPWPVQLLGQLPELPALIFTRNKLMLTVSLINELRSGHDLFRSFIAEVE